MCPKLTILLVQVVHNFRPMAKSSHTSQPDVCELGQERTGILADIVRVDDIVNDMTDNDE